MRLAGVGVEVEEPRERYGSVVNGRFCKVEKQRGRTRDGEGDTSEEGIRTVAENTRILRRTSAKCRRFENRSVSETTVARLTDDCRASGGVATLRGQRVTRAAITKVLSLAAPEFPPFPSSLLSRSGVFLSLFLSRAHSHISLSPCLFPSSSISPSVLSRISSSSLRSRCSFLGEKATRGPQKRSAYPSATLVVNGRVERKESRRRSSSRRRRHAASLRARLCLGTLPRCLCAFPPHCAHRCTYATVTPTEYIKSGWM